MHTYRLQRAELPCLKLQPAAANRNKRQPGKQSSGVEASSAPAPGLQTTEPFSNSTRPTLKIPETGPGSSSVARKAMKNEVWGSERLAFQLPPHPILPMGFGAEGCTPQHSDQGSMPPLRGRLLTAQALPQDDQRLQGDLPSLSRLLMAE